MDAIALLCNLHAEGPATLRRLRDGGIRTLADVRAHDPERLADVLGVPPAQARRFAREAEHLAERIGPEGLEPETSGAFAREETVPAGGGRAFSPDATDEVPPTKLRPRDRELVDLVLERWRDVPAAEAAPRAPAGTPLCARALEGLGERQVAGLAAAGVETMEALLAADALALGEESGLGFSAVRRLQFLARRAPAAAGRPALAGARPIVAEARRLSISERPTVRRLSIGEPSTVRQLSISEPPTVRQLSTSERPTVRRESHVEAERPRPATAAAEEPSLTDLLAPIEDVGPGGPFV